MSQKEILAIAIKVLSLWFLCYLFLNVATILPSILDVINQSQGNEFTVLGYIAFCLPFLVSGFIIFKLLFHISNSVFEKLSSEKEIFFPDSDHKFILQLCGLFFVVSSLTMLPSSLSFLFFVEDINMPWHFYLDPIQHLLQIAIGAWLILRSSWWGLLLGKLRGRA